MAQCKPDTQVQLEAGSTVLCQFSLSPGLTMAGAHGMRWGNPFTQDTDRLFVLLRSKNT